MNPSHPQEPKNTATENPVPKKPNEVEMPLRAPPHPNPDPMADKEENKIYADEGDDSPASDTK
ncbi:MAG: hypothetical protein AABZ31_12690 [Bdellovibrionota bacterium]